MLSRQRCRFVLVGGGILLACSGCGHPATEAECEAIFRANAEVELRAQGLSDPAILEQRVADARAAKGKELLEDCLGKRITDRAMACVTQAKTAEELDACLK
ncbi:MAG: hypothetical protein JRI68_01705 [Deltaproteobacteria bacterium]|nr:hypothetical protein [Deltaproteobacteria bacterium]